MKTCCLDFFLNGSFLCFIFYNQNEKKGGERGREEGRKREMKNRTHVAY